MSSPESGRSWTFGRAVPYVLGACLVAELGEFLYDRLIRGETGVQFWVAAGAFVASGAFFVLSWRRTILEFFRSVQVGIVVLLFAFAGSATGVLVPQIENFEDPEERVTEANYEENYKAFRWAVGYFVYHVVHPYGIGVPPGDLPEQAKQGIERLGRKYGKELASNREKEMRAAFQNNGKTYAIREHVDRNDGAYRFLFDLCSALDLNRAYKSGWFLGIMTLLFGCVLTNLCRFGWRPLFTRKRAGFALAHLGALTILAGGAVSKAYTVRGIMHLNIGRTSSEYLAFFNPRKPRHLPFELRLEDFKRDDWDKLEIHFLDEKFKSMPPRYTIWKGYTLPLDFGDSGSPRYTIRVLEKHPAVRISPPAMLDRFDPQSPLPPERWYPGLECEMRTLTEGIPSEPERRFLFAREGDLSILQHPKNLWRVRYLWAEDLEAARRAASEAVEERLGSLVVQIGRSPDTPVKHVPLRQLGEKHDLGKGWSVELLNAVGRFALAHGPQGRMEAVLPKVPLEEQELLKPAVHIRIRSPQLEKPEDRWVIDGVDAEELGVQHKFFFKDFYAGLAWDRWRSPVKERFWLLDSVEGGMELVPARPGTEPLPVGPGRPFSLPGNASLTVKKKARIADFQFDFTTLPEADFFHREPAGIVLEVRGPKGTEIHRLATVPGADRILIDGVLGIVYLEDDQTLPYEWRSRLAVVEADLDGAPRVVERGEIRVNDYFSWKGYHFFQTNAIPEDPTYSGIGVVYDPGMHVVVVGMYVVILGVALALFRRLAAGRESP